MGQVLTLSLLFALACTEGSPDVASDGTPTTPTASVPAPEAPTGGFDCPGWVVLNEAVSSNVTGLEDEDADRGDWLEVVALSADAPTVGVTLWGDGQLWALPDLTVGEPLLVWADGKDRVEPPHAPFSLDAAGETIALYAPDGCVLDAVTLPRMYADESYGRDLAGALGYFMEPTPGTANVTEWRPGFAPTPALPPGSFATAAVEVAVPVGADSVTTTLDGSIPEEDGTPAGTIDIEALTVVRARSFREGLWPSRIATGTYASEPVHPGYRVISLAVDPPDLWDEETGIYVLGPNAEPSYPYFGANFWQPWERDLHVEIWDASGVRVVAQDAGIEIAGGYSRAFDQRNFELVARGGYGPDDFSAQLFDQEDITSFQRLYLRNGGDWCGTQIIDATVDALFRDDEGVRLAAVDAQATEPAMVYLNGEFWGLYELKERLDTSWPAAHRGADADAQDFVKLGWTHDANWTLEAGDWEAWNALDAASLADLSDPVAWSDFERQADVVNFATAHVVQGWIANSDWWGNNIRMWRPLPDGPFRWMTYDFGHGWAGWDTDHLATTVGTSAQGMRVADALESEEFRVVLVNAHAELLSTRLTAANAEATVSALAAEVRPVMAAQRERWCGGPDLAPFDAAVAYAREFARQRAAAMDGDVVAWLAPSGGAQLTLDVEPAGAGTFALTVITVTPPFTGQFYRDTPVTVTAIASPGYTFQSWSDPALGTDPTVVVPLDGDRVLSAVFAGP